MEESFFEEMVTGILAEHYDLGELVECRELELGFVNQSFAVETKQDEQQRKWCFREYRPGIMEDELRFEHALILHLQAQGFARSAALKKTRSGETWVKVRRHDDEETYLAVFEWLPGEDRYTWVDPQCTIEDLKQSAIVLAEFHAAVAGFSPVGRRKELPIIELLPTLAETLQEWDDNEGSFGEYLVRHLNPLKKAVAGRIESIGAYKHSGFTRLAIHGDYHPGNLKFTGNQVSGLFDFDWSKIDLRAFDLGFALKYFCTSWQNKSNGEMMLDVLSNFFRIYQEQLKALPAMDPLTEEELIFLPQMISAAQIYILNWTLVDYMSKDVDLEEYLRYLVHAVRAVLWIDEPANQANIIDCMRKVA